MAGVVLDNFSGANIFAHFSNRTLKSIPRDLLKLVFGYSFDCLRVRRITGAISEKNQKAIRLAELIGFTFETKLRDMYSDGSSMLLYRLTRECCRFLPDYTLPHKFDQAKANGEFLSKRPQGNMRIAPDLSNRIPVEFGPAVRFSSGMSCSPFGFHIHNIIGAASQEKMARIDAQSIIALMQYTVGNRSEVKHPRCPMRRDNLLSRAVSMQIVNSLTGFADMSVVAGLGHGSSPNPTRSEFRQVVRDRSVFIHLLPKAISKRIRELLRKCGQLVQILVGHNQASFGCALASSPTPIGWKRLLQYYHFPDWRQV